MKKIAIIGSGFSSLSAACYLAKDGYDVSVYEKNSDFGGRARQFKVDGFRFDMGPSWYWMPDVFESFFGDFGKKVSDYYTLNRLSPSYRVVFDVDDYIDLPSDLNELYDLFESIEKGSAAKLNSFLEDAKYNYNVAINKIVKLPGHSPFELITLETVTRVSQFFKNINTYVTKKFKNEKLRQILEFPVLFLGAKPENTPYFYCFMNFADLSLGTWYPEGGMYKVVNGMSELADSLGVKFHSNSEVLGFNFEGNTVTGIKLKDKQIACDYIVNGGDYRHIEKLLPTQFQMYSDKYWDTRVMAPSSLLFYIGIDKKVDNVLHHNLFFDADFKKHASEIYDNPEWPTDPLFYANFTSKTDLEDAPEGFETCFLLMPIAAGIEDSKAMREKYFHIIMDRLELHTKQELKKHIVYKRSFCVDDFISEYHSFKGNAYGLANTLTQTAFLKPKLKNKKLKNFYNTGQLTVPGPGVPPALISGKIVSEQISKQKS
jgi:phytoene desaturase